MARPAPKRSLSDLTRFIVSHLVEDPESVVVEEELEDGELVLYVDVPEEERGAIIGRQGRTIRAIELVVRAAAGEGPVPTIEVAQG